MFFFWWVYDDNLKIDYENILFLFYLKSGVCCFWPIEKQQNRLEFACDRQSKIESEVYLIASWQKIISATLCATKVKYYAADLKINLMQRLN